MPSTTASSPVIWDRGVVWPPGSLREDVSPETFAALEAAETPADWLIAAFDTVTEAYATRVHSQAKYFGVPATPLFRDGLTFQMIFTALNPEGPFELVTPE